MKKSSLLKLINFWPPYLGAGIRVTNISSDLTTVDVEMKLRFWNRNYVGTHFGGSLYSMIDPFLMLMLLENLGKNYIVWDKAATIRFRKPARSKVKAHFQLDKEQINSIRRKADEGQKVEPEFEISILDDSDSIVAQVQKRLYVCLK